jgi:hypothetical protein
MNKRPMHELPAGTKNPEDISLFHELRVERNLKKLAAAGLLLDGETVVLKADAIQCFNCDEKFNPFVESWPKCPKCGQSPR